MNTPALSDAAAPFPAVPSRPGRRTEVRALSSPSAAGPRPLPLPGRRAPGATPSSAGEVLAGVLLLVVWTLLWIFFLAAVVEPGAALRSAAAAPAPRAERARALLAGSLPAPAADPVPVARPARPRG
ncbi:MAG TPA: hypothetical protein VMU15_07335 [Anaeromyxobacter sp.]|nr:hypothetical protein [Anaeromyxobacter sp.]